MEKYKLNGYNVENLLHIDNTSKGVSISSGFNFPNKYKSKIGNSELSYTPINYTNNGVDLGVNLSPKISVFTTVKKSTFTLQPNTIKFLAICLGGGAGGGGGNFVGGGDESGGGGGGGGGGGLTYIVYSVPLTNPRSLEITVGGGGGGGARGIEVGSPGGDGSPSSILYNNITICSGYGGGNTIQLANNRVNNNSGGEGGEGGGGFVYNDRNIIKYGVNMGADGGKGLPDRENGPNSPGGNGGNGGNGGRTTYTYNTSESFDYNKNISYYDSSTKTATMDELKFNNVNFFNSGNVLVDDDDNNFIRDDFIGSTNIRYVEGEFFVPKYYGYGGNGGTGEGRDNDSATNGQAGRKGFVIIAEYGCLTNNDTYILSRKQNDAPRNYTLNKQIQILDNNVF
jgi:hypothetical protein